MNAATKLGANSGALLVSPHTTAAVTIGENWDKDVTHDVERALAAWASNVRFDHGEGNSRPTSFRSDRSPCLVPPSKAAAPSPPLAGNFPDRARRPPRPHRPSRHLTAN